ncbi:hypothetical protein S7335_2263 [Synechococcus sp. PCC 7335]|uniref:CsbD family protein n=1 Tax=Synechococcus sp. (strain ATCC 29403 / PCC 7335) TaxID=91464 RepID=UPI00017ED8D3|nr:CsbD family protein [Synechococcus sp. PCC 7335]EDX84566.1 hypothetical protein S7335_2263 [Synechococcus sp. PCC 7335]
MVVLDQRLNALRQWFFRAACLVMVTIAIFGSSVASAYAVGSQAAADVVNERAAAELDRVAGAGASDQVEGAVDSAVGTIKRGVGATKDSLDMDSAANKIDGATDQLEGKVKRDIGRTKGAAADAADDVEDATGGVVESIKDFFN